MKSDGPDDKDEDHEDDIEGNWQFVFQSVCMFLYKVLEESLTYAFLSVFSFIINQGIYSTNQDILELIYPMTGPLLNNLYYLIPKLMKCPLV